MKRKIILILLIIIATTGCSINYDLKIKDNTIVETSTFTQEENSYYTKSYMKEMYNEEYPIFYDQEFMYYAPTEKQEKYTYYGKELKEKYNGYSAIYTATYTFNNYKRSRILNEAYQLKSIGYDNGTYYIIASNLKIFDNNEYITDINISIDLDGYEVIESNHHSKNGNIYTWHFNRNDSGNINLRYKADGSSNSGSNSNSSSSASRRNKNNDFNLELIIFLVIILIMIVIGYLIFNNMKNRSDRMDD